MQTTFVQWLVASMLTFSIPKAQHESQTARFTDIATDIVTVAFDPAEAPAFRGPAGRVKTAGLLASIASFESGGFDPKVDSGVRRGDSGNSWCMMQINLGNRKIVLTENTYEYAPASSEVGWSGKDLVSDRKKCIRAALHVIRESYVECGNLSGYTTGKCVENEKHALARLNRAKQMVGSFLDAAVEPATTLANRE